ncbi:MAG: UDP-N-acetylmuramoyl-tripeptide--D-alanyl-D-alanine ligase [Lachnospiraceae bacterium]|nr:UDP-N-acetylmuramoyl-tripeptide--D-alanyl-D-alanine ligase [Lachnospiraceae bacterium]
MLPITVEEIVNVTNGELLCGDENALVSGATTNSKNVKTGDIFVPIIGERVDGHNFIDMAIELGAVATFTQEHSMNDIENLNDEIAYIKVDDCLKALQTVAAYVRGQYDIPIVGITGSVGKTTTKEMIAAALEHELSIMKTEGNMNSQIGVALMMFRLRDIYDGAVIEMGISEVNEMKNLTNIAKPTFAVVTNIGVAHISQFKTQDNICREKLSIVDSFTDMDDYEDGYEILRKQLEFANLTEYNILFLNGDDKILKKVRDYKKGIIDDCPLDDRTKDIIKRNKVITYGLSDDCDYKAENVVMKNGCGSFDVVIDDITYSVRLNALGEHNIYNALVALAVANSFGVSMDDAIKGVESYKSMSMRGEIIDVNGIKIIDDTYNASPDSMKSGINVLKNLDNIKRRIAVLGDMFELGDEAYNGHYSVGEHIANINKDAKEANKIDLLITVGELAGNIARGAADCGIEIQTFVNIKDASVYLKDIIRPGDGILVKGSRGMKMDLIVNDLKNK